MLSINSVQLSNDVYYEIFRVEFAYTVIAIVVLEFHNSNDE